MEEYEFQLDDKALAGLKSVRRSLGEPDSNDVYKKVTEIQMIKTYIENGSTVPKEVGIRKLCAFRADVDAEVYDGNEEMIYGNTYRYTPWFYFDKSQRETLYDLLAEHQIVDLLVIAIWWVGVVFDNGVVFLPSGYHDLHLKVNMYTNPGSISDSDSAMADCVAYAEECGWGDD